MVRRGVKANAVNNVMMEFTTATWSNDGPHVSAQADPWRTQHQEMELEIVIIDKHFSYNLLYAASRKLQGCCSKLSSEATDFMWLRGASVTSCAQQMMLSTAGDTWWSFSEYMVWNFELSQFFFNWIKGKEEFACSRCSELKISCFCFGCLSFLLLFVTLSLCTLGQCKI